MLLHFKHNAEQFLIGVDQLLHITLGMIFVPTEYHYCDETMSSFAYRLDRDRGYKHWHKFINHIFFWQQDHCKEAYESEIDRLHIPPEMRQFD